MRGRIVYGSRFQTTEMSTDEWIGIELSKELPLVSVKLSVPALRYAADVIPRCDPLSWPDQLEGELAIIEAPKSG